jgi:hypothetical protein
MKAIPVYFLKYFFLLIFILLFFDGCTDKKPARLYQRSFYYWKSRFSLTTFEKNILKELSIKLLHIKFFDVEWNESLSQPRPVATIGFNEKIPEQIIVTPVVFITNKAIDKATPGQIDELAVNLINLISGICQNNQLNISKEVQVDCDWTVRTKDKYFQLLKKIKQQSFLNEKILSVTIRLHQLKFIGETGVPPADKGLLMCYNMGNLRHLQIKNSIPLVTAPPGLLMKNFISLPGLSASSSNNLVTTSFDDLSSTMPHR